MSQLKIEMQDVQPIAESKHDELLALLNPLLDFMTSNKYSFFLVAGKDGTCTRHMRGMADDLSAMLGGMAENNKDVKGILTYTVKELI